MGIGFIVLAFVLLALVIFCLLPVRLSLTYRERVHVTLSLLCFKLPFKGEKKKKGEKRKTDDKKQPPEPSLTLLENVRLIRAATAALLRKAKGHVRLTVKRLSLFVATGDAAGTAVLYGAVSASLAYLLSGAERLSRLNVKKDVRGVAADYLNERSRADVALVFSLPVWRTLLLLFTFFLTYVRRKRAILEKRTPSK